MPSRDDKVRYYILCPSGVRVDVADPQQCQTVTCWSCGRVTAVSQAILRSTDASTTLFIAPQPEAGSMNRRAAAFVSQGKYVEAIDLYRRILEEDPYHRDALYGLGYCYYKLGQLRRSQAFLQDAYELGHPGVERLLNKVKSLLSSS